MQGRLLRVKGALARAPLMLICIPLLIGLVELALGLWGALTWTNSLASEHKHTALHAGESAVAQFAAQLELAALKQAGVVVGLVAAQNHWIPTLQSQWDGWMRTILQEPSSFAGLRLVSQGRVIAAYPSNNGSNLVDDLLVGPGRADLLAGPTYGGLTLTRSSDPAHLTLHLPVFISNTTQNNTWGLSNPSPNCPTDICWNPATRTRWWGSVLVDVDLKSLMNRTTLGVADSDDVRTAIAYHLDATTPESILWSSHANECMQSACRQDPVWREVDVFNMKVVVHSWLDGGWTPEFRTGLIVAVVIFGVALMLFSFLVLLAWDKNRFLLHQLVPNETLKRVCRELDWSCPAPCTISKQDTPAQLILSLVSAVLEGRQPNISQAISIREAVAKGADLYRPLASKLGQRIKAADYMDVETRQALLNQLIGAEGMRRNSIVLALGGSMAPADLEGPLVFPNSNVPLFPDEGPDAVEDVIMRSGRYSGCYAAAPEMCPDDLDNMLTMERCGSIPSEFPPKVVVGLSAASQEEALPGNNGMALPKPKTGPLMSIQESDMDAVPSVGASPQAWELRMMQAAMRAELDPGSLRVPSQEALVSLSVFRGSSAGFNSVNDALMHIMTVPAPRPGARVGSHYLSTCSASGSCDGLGLQSVMSVGARSTMHLSGSSAPMGLAKPYRLSGQQVVKGEQRIPVQEDTCPEYRRSFDVHMGGSRQVPRQQGRHSQPHLFPGQATNVSESEVPTVPVARSLPLAVELALQSANHWAFDAFAFSEACEGRPLSVLGFWVLHNSQLMSSAPLHEIRVARFLRAIEDSYSLNPYHNRIHAADVLHSMHMLLTHGGVAPGYANRLGSLACYIAAIIHDVDHQGRTNDYLVAVHDKLAVRYNDKAPQENHHLASAWALLRKPEYNFLAGLSKAEWRQLRQMVIDLVMATDMKQHFSIQGQWQSLHGTAAGSPHVACEANKPASDKSVHRTSAVADLYVTPMTDNDMALGLQMALKCADLGHLAAPRAVHLKWVAALEAEFFMQGDAERTAGLPISPLCDRNKEGVSKSQVGFFDFVVLPLFTSFVQRFTAALPMLEAVRMNAAYWQVAGNSKLPLETPQPSAPSNPGKQWPSPLDSIARTSRKLETTRTSNPSPAASSTPTRVRELVTRVKSRVSFKAEKPARTSISKEPSVHQSAPSDAPE